MLFHRLFVLPMASTFKQALAKPLIAQPLINEPLVKSRAIMNISNSLELKNVTHVSLSLPVTRDVVSRDIAVRGPSGVSTFVQGRSSADASVVMGTVVTASYGLAGTVCVLGGLTTAGTVCIAAMIYAAVVTMFAFCKWTVKTFAFPNALPL